MTTHKIKRYRHFPRARTIVYKKGFAEKVFNINKFLSKNFILKICIWRMILGSTTYYAHNKKSRNGENTKDWDLSQK